MICRELMNELVMKLSIYYYIPVPLEAAFFLEIPRTLLNRWPMLDLRFRVEPPEVGAGSPLFEAPDAFDWWVCCPLVEADPTAAVAVVEDADFSSVEEDFCGSSTTRFRGGLREDMAWGSPPMSSSISPSSSPVSARGGDLWASGLLDDIPIDCREAR